MTGSIEDSLNLPDADKTLFILSLFEDERPLRGTIGLLDWRLRGLISRYIIQGNIRGKHLELTYLPVHYHGAMRHFLVVGLGAHSNLSNLEKNPTAVLDKIKTTLEKISFREVAISQSRFSFLNANPEKLSQAFGNIKVEMMP